MYLKVIISIINLKYYNFAIRYLFIYELITNITLVVYFKNIVWYIL